MRRLSLLVLLLGASLAGLAPAAAGGGCHASPDATMSSSADTDVTIGECAFLDTVIYVDPGERVTWTNKDPVPHTVTGAASSWGDEQILDRGEKVGYRFDDEGVYPYYCALHPSMVGAVVVGEPSAKLGTAAGGVEKVDLAASATTSDESPADSGGTSAAAITSMAIALAAVAAALVWRVTIKRRARAASSVA